MKITSENYASLQGWMRTELGLKGNELLTFAIIYGFTQDGDSYFTGSAQYIADWCGITKRAALDILKKLSEKGMIEKREVFENSVKFCHYRCKNFAGVVKKVHGGGEETSWGGGEETSPYNINRHNKEDNKSKIRRFAPPTLEEVEDYCLLRNNRISPQQFVDFYTAKGWKVGNTPMKDWKAAVRTWEQRDAEKRKPKNESRFYKAEVNDGDLPF